MDKISSTSLDITKVNIEKLKEVFPNVVTEGKIDFDVLKELLGDEIEDSKESYKFTWPGKNKSIKIAQEPSGKTLRPVIEDSVDWNNTNNLYIEGDNLEVLKQLQKTFYNKIDVIYIDPPYNTGTNLIYKNDFSISVQQYLYESGQSDEMGKYFVSNPSSSGRFHSDWLSMMYSRLMLARNLLTNQGIMAIAMDESEIGNLYKICQEIFGEPNILGTIITKCNPQGRGAKNLDPTHEYHILCAKNINMLDELKLRRNEGNITEYQTLMRSGTNSRKYERPYRFYPILEKNGKLYMITLEEYNDIYSNTLSFNEKHISNLTQKYESLGYNVIFPIAKNGEEKVWQRQYSRVVNEYTTYIYENGTIKTPKDEGKTPFTLWDTDKHNNVENGTNLIKKLFDGHKVFDYGKSIFTVKDIISLCPNKNATVLDFFSGSGTTAHAVMQLNQDDDGNRKFIMVQLPEKTQSDSEAYKMGYENICEIGKERIRRAIKSIEETNGLFESKKNGFKVFRLDSTNIKSWDNETQLDSQSLFDLSDVFKEGRSKEDILYEIMLKYGVFDMQSSEVNVNDKTMYRVGKRYMIVCLEDNVTSKDVVAIGELSPRTVIFKESGFNNDNDKINAVYNLEKAGVEDVKCI